MQAVLRGSLAMAVSNGEDCIAICVASETDGGLRQEDSSNSPRKNSKSASILSLAEASSNLHRKVAMVDEGMYMTFAGLSADGRVMLRKMRVSSHAQLEHGCGPLCHCLSYRVLCHVVALCTPAESRTGSHRP